MAYVFGIGCGGCVQVFDGAAGQALILLDSNNLPSEGIQVAWIDFDGTIYPIYDTFADKAALLSYLNTTFDSIYNPEGFWAIQGELITYTNPEKYTSAEIVAIISSTVTVFRVGNPGGTVRPGLTVVNIANGSPLQSGRLIGIDPEAVQIFADTQYQAQLSEVFAIDTDSGTITLSSDYRQSDTYYFVYHTQRLTGSAVITDSFPYTLPFQLA